MIKIIRNYLNQNLFYVSVIITGVVSLLAGVFYALLKNKVFEMASSNFLEGTGVLGTYVTTSTDKPSAIYYFLIGLFCGLCFFFIISFILRIYLKTNYFKVFNLFGILNIFLFIGLILAIIFINFTILFTYGLLFILIILYLFVLYKCLDLIFKLNMKKKIVSLVIFILPVIMILIILKLFV